MENKQLFQSLNEKLKEKNIQLNLICAGGYVLESLGIRQTKDIDAFYKETNEIKSIINELGNEFNLNNEEENWLNNSIQNLNPVPPEKAINLQYSFSHLNVYIVKVDYLIGMKTNSLRNQDVEDIGQLIAYQKYTDPKKLYKTLSNYGFSPDQSILLEGFGKAYGLDWLVNYYQSHEDQIDFDGSKKIREEYDSYLLNDDWERE